MTAPASPQRGWPGRGWLIGGLLLIVGGAAAVTLPRGELRPAGPATAASQPALGIGALGRIEPRSRVRKLSPLNAMEATRLHELHVAPGDEVKAGARLATFGDYEQRRTAVAVAEGQLGVARARLAQVQAGAKPDDLRAQRARIASAAATERMAEIEFRRLQRAAAAEAASPDELNRAEQALHAASAERAAAEALLGSLAEVRAVDVSLAAAEVAAAEAGLRQAQVNLELAQLRAPFDGRVLRILAWPGEQAPGEGVLEFADLERLDVVAEVYETDLPRVNVGQRAEVIVPDIAERLTGVVYEIGWQVRKKDVLDTDPVADIDARVVEVRIELDPQSAERVRRMTHMQVDVVLLP